MTTYAPCHISLFLPCTAPTDMSIRTVPAPLLTQVRVITHAALFPKDNLMKFSIANSVNRPDISFFAKFYTKKENKLFPKNTYICSLASKLKFITHTNGATIIL